VFCMGDSQFIKLAACSHSSLLIGSPGIGKSYFLFYLMWSLVNSSVGTPLTIIVQSRGKPVLCFQGSEVLEGTAEDFRLQLAKPDTWLLVDGMVSAVFCIRDMTRLSSSSLYPENFLKMTGACASPCPNDCLHLAQSGCL